MTVKPGEHPNLAQRFLTARRVLTNQGVGITLQRQAVDARPQAVHREDVDEDAPLLERMVVQALVKKRIAVAQLSIEIVVILVGVVGLQDNMLGQFVRKDF